MFRSEVPGVDQAWYNDVQGSYSKVIKEENLAIRNSKRKQMIKQCAKSIAKRPYFQMKQEDVIGNYREAFERIEMDIKEAIDNSSEDDSSCDDMGSVETDIDDNTVSPDVPEDFDMTFEEIDEMDKSILKGLEDITNVISLEEFVKMKDEGLLESESESDQSYVSSPQVALVQNCKDSRELNLRNCVLLDSESTVHAFCNKRLVNSVWELIIA